MKYFLYLPVLILTIYLSGCSELETDIVQSQPSPGFHEEGVLDQADPDFHGKLISNSNWDMNQCQQCHGGNYEGGLAEVSCNTCHNEPAGPENCSTCHGSGTSPAPPEDLSGNTSTTEHGVGAHQVHLGGNSKGKIVTCSTCHNVPTSYYTAGHIDSDYPAEVPMNGFLATLVTNDPLKSEVYNPGLETFIPDPRYNFSVQTCSDTYCHGMFKNGNNGKNGTITNSPSWTNPASVVCGTCHGDPDASTLHEKALPGGSHIDVPPPPIGESCSYCHGGVINEDMIITNPSKHIDGKLNILRDDGTFDDVTF